MYSSESYNISFVSLKMASSYHFDGTHIRKIELSLNEKYQLVLTNPAICLQYLQIITLYYILSFNLHFPQGPKFFGNDVVHYSTLYDIKNMTLFAVQ